MERLWLQKAQDAELEAAAVLEVNAVVVGVGRHSVLRRAACFRGHSTPFLPWRAPQQRRKGRGVYAKSRSPPQLSRGLDGPGKHYASNVGPVVTVPLCPARSSTAAT